MLDGDTAPCLEFEYHTFQNLLHNDIFTTRNPFGFVSTNDQKIYTGSPNHPQFKNFPEINGGVIGITLDINYTDNEM